MTTVPPLYTWTETKTYPKQPWTCPVCTGRGFVSPGFYSCGTVSNLTTESCRSCKGSGVVWQAD